MAKKIQRMTVSDERLEQVARGDLYGPWGGLNVDEAVDIARELAEARKVIASLPKTEDGVPIVPGMLIWHPGFWDEDKDYRGEPNGNYCWIGPISRGPVSSSRFVSETAHSRSYPCEYAGCYSTREAAAQAKEPTDGE